MKSGGINNGTYQQLVTHVYDCYIWTCEFFILCRKVFDPLFDEDVMTPVFKAVNENCIVITSYCRLARRKMTVSHFLEYHGYSLSLHV